MALALFSSVPARAETVGVLPVASPPGPSADLVELTSQLRKSFAERTTGVLDAQQLRERMTGQAPGATLAELDRAYDGARQSYRQGDVEGSVRTLRAIVQELEKLPEEDEVFAQWQRAMLRLAREESDLGHADAAQGLVERLVRASPQVRVDTSQFPPKFVAQVEEARTRLARLPVRKLAVTATTRGVKVYVNGRSVGTAPVTLQLAQGQYRVSASAGGTRVPPVQVDLAEGDGSAVLDLTIPESLRPGLGPGLAVPEADRARLLVAIGGFLRLDSILAATFVEDGGAAYLAGALYDVRRGMLTREGRVRLGNRTVPTGGIAALTDFLMTGQSSSMLVEVPGMPPASRPDLSTPLPGSGSPDLKLTETTRRGTSVLGWTAFGTGIAAVGLAGVSIWQAVAANTAYSNADALAGPNGAIPSYSVDQYKQYMSTGDSAQSTAIITGVAAGVCAAGTVALSIISGELGPIRF